MKKLCLGNIFIISFLLASVMFVGCKKNEEAATGGKKIKIGVIHLLAAHPDHILLRESFLEGLKSKGYDVDVTVFDANSAKYPDTYTERAAKEAERMEAAGIQLIYTTAVYHGIVKSKIKIPVIDSVFIAPYLQKLADKKGTKGYSKGNATGTVFGYSFKDIVNIAKALRPKEKKLAYIFSSISPISRPPAEIREAARKVGLEIVEFPFKTKEEALEAVKKAAKFTKIGFGTNDIAVLGAEAEATKIANSLKYPLVYGVVPLVDLGAVAAIQYNWARAGKMCADKADKILKGTKANTIPMEFSDNIEIGINLKTIKALGIKTPHDWVEAATKVVE